MRPQDLDPEAGKAALVDCFFIVPNVAQGGVPGSFLVHVRALRSKLTQRTILKKPQLGAKQLEFGVPISRDRLHLIAYKITIAGYPPRQGA
jgi:hypothetical protein